MPAPARRAAALLLVLAAATGGLPALHGGAAAQGGAAPPPGHAEATRLAETPEVLPPGEGREEVFHTCTACHGTAVIRRSRLDRQQWDDLMDWMVEKHGMNPLEGEDRRLIVDYLSTTFPSSAGGRRRAANPFRTD